MKQGMSADPSEFFKAPGQEKEKVDAEELDMDELEGMKVRSPKPAYDNETEVLIQDMKFYRRDEVKKDKANTAYTSFFVQLTFKETGDGGIEFTETYNGGRFYDRDGQTQIYIGPKSQLGRFQNRCTEAGIPIGTSFKSWISAIKGKKVMLKNIPSQFEGQQYVKNQVTKFITS
jgi:hypothetical protein